MSVTPGGRQGPPVDEARSLSARAAQRRQILPQLTGCALHAGERVAGNLLLRLACAEARVELAERPVSAAEHRLLTALLPNREGLLGLRGLRLRPHQYLDQPALQRSRRNDRLHALDQLVEPTTDRREGGAREAAGRRSADLVCADIAGGDPIAVAILRTGETALVGGGWRTVVPAGVDRRTAGQQRLGRGGATVVLQRTELRVHVDEVPRARKAAGVAAVQVVPLGSQGGAGAASTVVPRRTVRDDHVAEGGSAEVVEAATAARGGAVVRDGDVGQCCDRVGEVVSDTPPAAGTRRVSAHRDIGQRGRQRIVDASAEVGGSIAAHDAVGQGEVIDARDAAPVAR